MTCVTAQDSNTSALYKKILAASYQPPSFISESVKELIAGLLTVDPVKRFTIADVRAHPWYQQASFFTSDGKPECKPQAARPGVPGGLDEDVLEELKRHGFPRERPGDEGYAINCLQNNKHNSVTTTYYLLAAKRRRMMEHLQMQQEKKRNAANERPASPASRPGASREAPKRTSPAPAPPSPAEATHRMVTSPDPTHRVFGSQLDAVADFFGKLASPQMASPQAHVSTPKASPAVVVTPNGSMSRPCGAPPSPSVSGRALSQDKHAQAASPNSSRVVTPTSSRPMTGFTGTTPISSRTPSHEAPKDAQLSPGTNPRTTREAVVPSSVCLDGQARYIIRPMSSKVSRLTSVPVGSRPVTAPATPRQTLSARGPSRDSPLPTQRFTMVDGAAASLSVPADASRFEEISRAQKTSVAATYHLLAKRKKTEASRPGASTLDQRTVERPMERPKVKEAPKITPRQVLASPHYGVRQVITPRVAGSPVQMSRVVGSPAVTPRVSPMPRAMAVSTMPQARMAYPTAWACSRH
eukprot:Skav228456  [mRNA]  locus=scaffold1058:221962:226430:- [translate_table: standard]